MAKYAHTYRILYYSLSKSAVELLFFLVAITLLELIPQVAGSARQAHIDRVMAHRRTRKLLCSVLARPRVEDLHVLAVLHLVPVAVLVHVGRARGDALRLPDVSGVAGDTPKNVWFGALSRYMCEGG